MSMESIEYEAIRSQNSIANTFATWNNIRYAHTWFHDDKVQYSLYKTGEVIDETKIEEMQILKILEELGYPMEELGTYLYKCVIKRAYDEIRENDLRHNSEGIENLMLSLNYKLSNLYHDVARNDLDMGVKSFHQYIDAALLDVDDEKANASLKKDIYGDKMPNGYGTGALMIALYLEGRQDKLTEKKVK